MLDASGKCRRYARDGRLEEEVKLVGALPRLAPGRNRIAFGLGNKAAGGFRVKVMTAKSYR